MFWWLGVAAEMIKTVITLSTPQKSFILLLVDLVLVPLAFLLALSIQYSTLLPVWRLLQNWPFVPLLMLTMAALTMMLGLRRVRLKEYNLSAILRSGALAALLGMTSAALAALGEKSIPAGFHFIFALVFFALYSGVRLSMLHLLLAIYRRSRAVTRVAIYGAGRTGMTLASALRNCSDIVPYAFLDDNATLRGVTVCGLPVHSGVHADRVLKDFKIDRVILAMPSLSVHKQTYLSQRLEKLGLEVQALPAFAQLIGGDELLDKLLPSGPAALLTRDALHDAMGTGCGEYQGANVLITGAGGSIGLELCRQILRCRPAKIVLFELSELALYNAEAEMAVLTVDTEVEIVPVLGSIADAVLVATVLANHRIDAVLHAAAYKHVPLVEANLRVGMANNALGTAVLAQKSREAGVRRFVLVSSDKAVRPANVMGASKRFAELVVQDLATRPGKTIFSIVRFGNVLGSSGSVIPLFQEQIARGGPVTLTDEGVTRYFMTIQEAARLVLLAGSFAEGGEVFVLDMGAPIFIRDLARKLIEASGYLVRDAANPHGDIEIVTTGLRPGEKMHEELMMRKGAQTTAHPKIIRVREDRLSELEMAGALRDLREAIDTGSDAGVLGVLARAVPEYHPQSLPDHALPMQVVSARKAGDLPAE